MLGSLPLLMQNLNMGSPAAAASSVNFVEFAVRINGVATPAILPYAPSAAASAAILNAGVVLDKIAVDLSAAGYTRNGAFFLSLAPSTPLTVDLTATGNVAPATAGDGYFTRANELIFNNTGSADVVVSPGASSGFNGPLSGTAPLFTVPSGGRIRWHNPAGWPVTAIAKNLKFDPGGSAAQIGVSIGGS